MKLQRLLGAASAFALGGAALAQTPPQPPAQTPPAPAVVRPTPPVATPVPAAPGVIRAAPAMAGRLTARGDIVETLKADGQFKTFVKALETANMTGVLKTNRNLTVFAPPDAAFAALPPGELDRLMNNPAELQRLLTYHVVNATVDSTKIRGARGGVRTVAGSDLVIDGSGADLRANNATIVQTDVMATNGTVHVVDKVLSPATAPGVAAATGTRSDVSATTGEMPPTPPAPRPPASPTQEPAVPPTPEEKPTLPQGAPPPADSPKAMGLSCQNAPGLDDGDRNTAVSGPVTPAQKRSVQDIADETRPEPPAAAAMAAETYAAPVAATAPAYTGPRVVTNGPVPDTPENRARYGGPMSRAGQRTTPSGN
ncbi:MAG: fasciclin domain-containing protein [Pseudomonadota bacterium]